MPRWRSCGSGGGLAAAKATLTFTPAGAARTLAVTGEVQVALGGTLRMATNGFDGMLTGDALVIDGTVHLGATLPLTTNYITVDSLVNRGLLAVDTVIVGTYITLTGPMALRNAGQVQMAAGVHVIATAPAASAYLEGGGISGISLLTFGGGGGNTVFDVWWTGGSFTGTDLAVNSGTLHLGNTALQGVVVLDPYGGTSILEGDIGPEVHVHARAGPTGGTLQLQAPAGGVLRNEGTLEFYSQTDTLLVQGASLANAGLVQKFAGVTDLDLDSVTNTGTIQAQGGTLRLVRNTGFLRNAGTIDGGHSIPHVILSGAEYISEAGGVQTGGLWVENAVVSGTGALGDVTLVSASLEPGAPVGVLTATSLTMDPASGMIFDVAGETAGSYDVLDVAGQVSLAGSFTLREVAPFAGGTCGQALPLILDQSPLPRGAFTKLTGLSPGLGRGYRLFAPAGSTYLVGYNPIPLVSLAPGHTRGRGRRARGGLRHLPPAPPDRERDRQPGVRPRAAAVHGAGDLPDRRLGPAEVGDGDGRGRHPGGARTASRRGHAHRDQHRSPVCAGRIVECGRQHHRQRRQRQSRAFGDQRPTGRPRRRPVYARVPGGEQRPGRLGGQQLRDARERGVSLRELNGRVGLQRRPGHGRAL
jgi:hypothetical protein